VAVGIAAALMLTSCGSSTSSPATTASGSAASIFGAMNVSSLGQVLVDGNERTVYVLTSGIQSAMLGTMELSDGKTYPTYNGWLMYEYSGDSGPDQAGGEDISSYGGTWYVLSPSGNPIIASASSSSREAPTRGRSLESQRGLSRPHGASDRRRDRWRETV